MSYAPGVSAVQPAVKSPAPRSSQRFPIGNGTARLPVVARRQSARTSVTNPAKGVGTLKGSGVR